MQFLRRIDVDGHTAALDGASRFVPCRITFVASRLQNFPSSNASRREGWCCWFAVHLPLQAVGSSTCKLAASPRPARMSPCRPCQVITILATYLSLGTIKHGSAHLSIRFSAPIRCGTYKLRDPGRRAAEEGPGRISGGTGIGRYDALPGFFVQYHTRASGRINGRLRFSICPTSRPAVNSPPLGPF
ncbi:hypothetical protein VTK56DRAFT_7317 [Thermocarpiscus australiensis]